MAPSAEPDDTPSVNGVASGLRSSACITTPATRQCRAHQTGGEHAWQSGDEEDLGVQVVGKGTRAVERPRGGRAPSNPTSGAPTSGGQQQRTEDGIGAPRLSPPGRRRLRRAARVVRTPRARPRRVRSRLCVVTARSREQRAAVDA